MKIKISSNMKVMYAPMPAGYVRQYVQSYREQAARQVMLQSMPSNTAYQTAPVELAYHLPTPQGDRFVRGMATFGFAKREDEPGNEPRILRPFAVGGGEPFGEFNWFENRVVQTMANDSALRRQVLDKYSSTYREASQQSDHTLPEELQHTTTINPKDVSHRTLLAQVAHQFYSTYTGNDVVPSQATLEGDAGFMTFMGNAIDWAFHDGEFHLPS